jgi:hypothetical protein
MRIVDRIPQSFVESDFVTKQRLKYETSPAHRKITNTIAFATGAALGTAAIAGMYVGLKKLEEKLTETN